MPAKRRPDRQMGFEEEFHVVSLLLSLVKNLVSESRKSKWSGTPVADAAGIDMNEAVHGVFTNATDP